MTNLVAVSALTDVPQLETSTLALAGPGAVMNAQAQALLNRQKHHTDDSSNPHSVTKSQVGLGNCDNTSDMDKPVSTAQQSAIDAIVAGSNPGAGWAQYLCSMMEPDAIEPMQTGTFSYSVGANETKILVMSWSTRIGSSGRMELRNPKQAMMLRGCTLNGIQSGSVAVIINPTIPTYIDPWLTYYSRLQSIAELPTKNIVITAAAGNVPFLPGPYGAIITQYTCFDFAWLILRQSNTYGPNLWDEISDSASQRIGGTLSVPVSKATAGEIESSAYSSGTPLGSVSFVLLPSDWSVIPDPVSSSYVFRDDFMSASLDSGIWTKSESTAGNVSINTTYQWCKIKGNGTWGANAMKVTASTTRSEGVSMVVDVFCARATSGQGVAVEWNNGGGFAQTNGAHRVEFGASYNLNIFEDGTSRAVMASGWSIGSIYRVKITLHADGSAAYSIQGGKEYPKIGGATWQDITPGTSYSADNTLHPSASAYGAFDYYISDVRVF